MDYPARFVRPENSPLFPSSSSSPRNVSLERRVFILAEQRSTASLRLRTRCSGVRNGLAVFQRDYVIPDVAICEIAARTSVRALNSSGIIPFEPTLRESRFLSKRGRIIPRVCPETNNDPREPNNNRYSIIIMSNARARFTRRVHLVL